MDVISGLTKKLLWQLMVNGKDPDFFSSGLLALEHCWTKSITLEGNTLKKKRWI